MGPSLRVFWRIHRAFMRLTGGRFGRVGAMDALLLTTTGRKSGDRRDVAVNYMRDGDSYVSDPDAEVTLAGKRARVRARETDGAERDRLWSRFIEADPAYAEYQRRTKRRLPVVLLVPIG